MTVSNKNPVADSLLLPGDEFSFDLNDGGVTPSSIQVTVKQLTDDIAWTLAGGFQPGFSGTAQKVGNVYTVTVSASSGWDKSPFTVQVDWTISGTPSTSSWSYSLATEAIYPDLMQPRNPDYQGTLRVTDNGVSVRTDVGWQDFVGFTVANLGNGKVRIVNASGLQSKLDGTTAPTVTDDSDAGYSVGSVWVDINNDNTYTATDVTVGAANWEQTNGAGGGGTSYSGGFGSWLYDSASTSGAGIAAGDFRLNNADPGSATELYLSTTSNAGVVLSSILDIAVGERLAFFGASDTETFYATVDSITNSGSYFTYEISGAIEVASSLTNNAEFLVQLLPSNQTWANYRGLARWDVSSVAGAVPAQGEVSFDSAFPSLTTTINLHYDETQNNLNVSDILLAADGGFITVRTTDNSGRGTFDITAAVDNTTYVTLTVTFNDGTGTFAVGDIIEVFVNVGSAATKLAFSLGGSIQANAAVNNWIGHEADSLWTTLLQNENYGSGATPAVTVVDVGYPMPYTGTITKVVLWYRPSGVNCDGDFALAKSTFTDASSSVTTSLLGSLMVVPSGGSSSNAYDISTTFTSGHSVTAGDTVNLFYRNTGVGGGNIKFRCTFILEVA